MTSETAWTVTLLLHYSYATRFCGRVTIALANRAALRAPAGGLAELSSIRTRANLAELYLVSYHEQIEKGLVWCVCVCVCVCVIHGME
jgi:hypothetical protein